MWNNLDFKQENLFTYFFTGLSPTYSVTRLGLFWKFFTTNIRAYVAQIFGNFLGFLKNVTF